MNTQSPVWLTDEEVAARYNVSRISIWRWARECDFPKPRKISGNTTRWYAPELDEHDMKIVQGGAAA